VSSDCAIGFQSSNQIMRHTTEDKKPVAVLRGRV
jgi:hypothetical protein